MESPLKCDEIHIAVQLAAAVSRVTSDACPWGALADALCELPDVTTVAIFIENESGDLEPYRISGRHAWALKPLVIHMGERMTGWVAAVGEPMLNADPSLDLFDVAAESLRSAAAVPTQGPRGARAVIALYSSRRDAFLPLHRRLVEEAVALVASHEATARARADLLQEGWSSGVTTPPRLRVVASDVTPLETAGRPSRSKRAG
jgi:hypothetical protein